MQQLQLEPGDYLITEPETNSPSMLLSFRLQPDGRLTNVFYGQRGSANGVRLMEKIHVDSRVEQDPNAGS